MKKISTKDWSHLPLDDWNVTTVRAYMYELHEKTFGIKYTANNYAIEGRFIKNMLAEYGAEATKRFIEACFDDYKPTVKYPALNFGFMYSYMRERILPRVLKGIETERQIKQRESSRIDKDYF